MKIFEGLRRKIGTKQLHQRINQAVRYKEYNNLKTAKTAGVIFDATRQDAFTRARDFILELRKMGIETHGMGYALTAEAASFFNFERDIDVFSVSNVNWYFKPNNPITDAFCQHEFDMLIDLSMGKDLPLNFIVGLSMAKLKIGNAESDNPYYDLIFSIPPGKDLNYYLDQIRHYLGNIQRKAPHQR